MGSGNIRWLLAELPGLVTGGVLDAAAAERLRGHYATRSGPERRWAVIGLGVFGAALIGAGVTLVLAHNWEALARPARAAIALGLLVVAQAIAGFSTWRRPGSAAWREGSATGWVFSTGAAMGLITQTYHLAVEPGEFLALWTLLTLPIVWLMRSRVATALAWCGAGPAAMMGAWPGIDDTALFWVFAALLAPVMAWFALRLRDDRLATLPFWSAAAWLPIASLAHTMPFGTAARIVFFPALFAGLHALGCRIEPPALSAWRRPLWLVGGAGSAALMLVLSFSEAWSPTQTLDPGDRVLAWTLTAGVFVAAMALAVWQAIAALRRRDGTTALLLGAPIVVAALHLAVTRGVPVAVAALACSAWLLAVGLLALIEGTRHGSLGRANAGMAMLAALATARFFDADVSLLARGLAFVAVGLAFLGLNVWMLRQRRHAAPHNGHEVTS